MLNKAIQKSCRVTNGYNVFHSKRDVELVLREVQRATKRRTRAASWWHAPAPSASAGAAAAAEVAGSAALFQSFDQFVDAIAALDVSTFHAPPQHAIIVVEGLDGVGKTTVTKHLASRIGGALVRTPGVTVDPLRAHFRTLPEPLSRAFYAGANYLAAAEITRLAQQQPVVVDRWWASTCAMALAANHASLDLLPPVTSQVYQWPGDLPLFTAGFMLDVSEELRLQRVANRRGAEEQAEERALAAKAAMRAVAMEAYRRMLPSYENIGVPNYAIAINDMLDAIGRATCPSALCPQVIAKARFSREECDAIAPY